MSVQDDLARKKINEAIDALKKQWSAAAMTLPLNDEGNAKRLLLVAQFQSADDLAKMIALETMKR